MKYRINEDGSHKMETSKAIYEAHSIKKYQNETTMLVQLKISSKVNGFVTSIKLDLFDYLNIQSRCKQVESAFQIPANDLAFEINDLAIRVSAAAAAVDVEFTKIEVTDKKKAMSLLKDINLLDVINTLLGKQISGEENNRLLAFLIAISYKAEKPLHCIVQAISNAGKTHLINTVTQYLPKEDVKNISVITASALLNMSTNELLNKCVVIEDLVGIDKKAEYHLREIQSKKLLSVAKSRPNVNRSPFDLLETHLSSLSATTSESIYRDNENRSFVIQLDESEEQTSRINALKAKYEAGLIDEEGIRQNKILLSDAIRLLKNEQIVNPFAEELILPIQIRDRRRLTDLLYGLIRVITLLHQYQRDQDNQDRLIVEKQDVLKALVLLESVLESKSDELTKTQREFYQELLDFVESTKSEQELTDYNFKLENLETVGIPVNSSTSRKVKQLFDLGFLARKGNQKDGFLYRIKGTDNHSEVKTQIENLINKYRA